MAGGSNPPSATSSSPIDTLASALDEGARSLDIGDDAELLLAVSGGGDSMALLHAAARLVESGARAWRLVAAHLDHGLHEDSAQVATFVAEVARSLGLVAHVERADVRAVARSERRSVEDAGRQARYRFLEAVASPGAQIVTAHTADDAAETVLMNLLRGSGLAGTRGIPARRGRIVRPLLGQRRDALRSLLTAAGIDYRDDPANEDPDFLRNRVRHEVLPLLESLRPGAVDRIGQFARLAGDDDTLLDAVADAELTRRRLPTREIDWHDPPDAPLARRVLRRAIGEPAPSFERMEALLAAAGGDRGGVRIELGIGRTASVHQRRISIE